MVATSILHMIQQCLNSLVSCGSIVESSVNQIECMLNHNNISKNALLLAASSLTAVCGALAERPQECLEYAAERLII